MTFFYTPLVSPDLSSRGTRDLRILFDNVNVKLYGVTCGDPSFLGMTILGVVCVDILALALDLNVICIVFFEKKSGVKRTPRAGISSGLIGIKKRKTPSS